MTIKDTVKQALIHVQGNQVLPLFVVQLHVARYQQLKDEFTGEQIRRALRDLKHVKRMNGCYVVKGRKVPCK